MCVYCVYLCMYINTNTCMYIFKKKIVYILNVFIYNIKYKNMNI